MLVKEPSQWFGPGWTIRRIAGSAIEFDLFLVRINETNDWVVREWTITKADDGPEWACLDNPHGQHLRLPGPIVRRVAYDDDTRHSLW